MTSIRNCSETPSWSSLQAAKPTSKRQLSWAACGDCSGCSSVAIAIRNLYLSTESTAVLQSFLHHRWYLAESMHGADYSKWFHAAIVSSVVAVSTFLLIPNHADPDLWGHVQFGRDLLEYGLPTTATYTYTAEGYPWINHENLSELAFACVVSTWGIGQLVMLGTLLGLVIVSVITFHLRASPEIPSPPRSLDCWWHSTWYFTGAFVHSCYRSCFSAGYCCCLSTPCHTEKKRASCRPENPSRRTRWLWGLVAIMWLWTNSHGGFAAGLAIVLVYLLGRVVEDRFCNDRFSRAELLRIALVTCAILCSTLINPYGRVAQVHAQRTGRTTSGNYGMARTAIRPSPNMAFLVDGGRVAGGHRS